MTPTQPFVTLFTVPKPFSGLAVTHQTNAVKSWSRLGDRVEIILCGDEDGVADAAHAIGARHLPDITRNEYGTPLISSAFEAARVVSTTRLLCYINTDIILMSDFLETLEQLTPPRFVLCGRRWNVELPELLDFDAPDWERDLRALAQEHGVLHAPEAMDYFVFPRGLIRNMPPFAIGRTVWDNWLLFHARALGAPIIDATAVITIVHQNHAYSHIAGGIAGAWHGPEARRNRALGSEMLFPFSIQDATFELHADGLKRRRDARKMVRLAQSCVAIALRRQPSMRRFLRAALRAKEV
jgi:hypothetical protein